MTPDLTHARWRKSSYSSGEGQCLEVAELPSAVAARDSKDPQGPALIFGRDGWTRFVQGVTGDKIRP